MKIVKHNKEGIIESIHLYKVNDNIIGLRVWLSRKWGCKLNKSSVSNTVDTGWKYIFYVKDEFGIIDGFDIITESYKETCAISTFFVADMCRYEINAVFLDSDIVFPYHKKTITCVDDK